MKFNTHIREEKIIDFVLENVDEVEKQRIWKHVQDCQTCKGKWQEWKQSLVSGGEEPTPSPILKHRVMKSVKQKQSILNYRINFQHMMLLISSAAVMFLCFQLYTQLRSNDASHEVMQHDDIEQYDFAERPQANHLNIVPASNNSQISGHVWFDNVTNEMLVEADGIVRLRDNDYQLWLINGDQEVYGQLLDVKDDAIRLYYKGDYLNRVNIIRVSIEPLGGSDYQTGPDTFYVNFND